MKKFKEALWNDYDAASEKLKSNGLKEGSDEHKAILSERDNVRNELLKLEQIEQDNMMKISEIESENKREKIRNGITIGTFVVSTSVSVFAIAKTFKFDQAATVTSTLGRSILNGVIPKAFKR